MEYELKAPLFFVGQNVRYKHHNGNLTEGKICLVTTNYSKHRDSENYKGYHIYAINKKEAKRSWWIGERKIIEVMPNAT
jgi:hypothetical protein